MKGGAGFGHGAEARAHPLEGLRLRQLATLERSQTPHRLLEIARRGA